MCTFMGYIVDLGHGVDKESVGGSPPHPLASGGNDKDIFTYGVVYMYPCRALALWY